MKICPVCSNEINDDAKFCENCGNKFETEKPKENVCSKCGKVLSENAKFCNGCGTPVAAPAQPVIADAQPAEFRQDNIPIQNVVPQQTFQNNPAPQQTYVPPQMAGVTPGKKGSSVLVPIILIILIIAVICADVFWLFKDQIFGKDDSQISSNCAVCTVAEDYIL